MTYGVPPAAQGAHQDSGDPACSPRPAAEALGGAWKSSWWLGPHVEGHATVVSFRRGGHTLHLALPTGQDLCKSLYMFSVF